MYHFTLKVIITTPMEMLKIQLQMAGTQTTSRSHVYSAAPSRFGRYKLQHPAQTPLA